MEKLRRIYKSNNTCLSGMINLNFLSDSDISNILKRLDEVILIKKDQNITTGFLEGEKIGFADDLFIKKFHFKSFWHDFYHRIIGNKACRLFNVHLGLLAKALPVPAPFAWVEDRKKKECFFISRFYKKSENLGILFKKGISDPNKLLVKKITTAVATWHLRGAVHGDLKWSNLLISEDHKECFFIDLDQAKYYTKPNISGIVRDLQRFYRFSLEIGGEEWVKNEVFPLYISQFPRKIQNKIPADKIVRAAYKIWKSKGGIKL